MTKYSFEEFKTWLKEQQGKELTDISGLNLSYNFISYIEYPGDTTYTPYLKKYKAWVDNKFNQLLKSWTSLKTKLLKLTFLVQNKELFKAALNSHLNWVSSFVAPTYSSISDPSGLGIDMPTGYRLTPLGNPPRGDVEMAKQYVKKSRWNTYLARKIVKECRELLEKLKTI